MQAIQDIMFHLRDHQNRFAIYACCICVCALENTRENSHWYCVHVYTHICGYRYFFMYNHQSSSYGLYVCSSSVTIASFLHLQYSIMTHVTLSAAWPVHIADINVLQNRDFVRRVVGQSKVQISKDLIKGLDEVECNLEFTPEGTGNYIIYARKFICFAYFLVLVFFTCCIWMFYMLAYEWMYFWGVCMYQCIYCSY